MTGVLTTVKFQIFPDQIFTEIAPSSREALTLKIREAYLVEPVLNEKRLEWLTPELRHKIISTNPYNLSDRHIHHININEIHKLNELTQTGIPTLVITNPAPRSSFYQFMIV